MLRVLLTVFLGSHEARLMEGWVTGPSNGGQEEKVQSKICFYQGYWPFTLGFFPNQEGALYPGP